MLYLSQNNKIIANLFGFYRETIYFCIVETNKNKRKDMSIVVNVDVMMAKRKMSLSELAEKIGITPANLSILKTGKAKAVRFTTLDSICRALDCTPGDVLEFRNEDETL